MKHTIKFLSLVFLMILNSSCADGDKEVFDLQNGTEAPYVRIILDNKTVDSSVLNTATINGTISAPADNVASWTVGVRITGSVTTDFVDVKTVTSFPSSISISVDEIASLLDINITDIQPADVIEFSGRSEGTNGVKITRADLTRDLSSQPEQRNAYQFSVIVFCAPVAAPFTGNWTLNLEDSYGDGWDGAFITATIDGVATNYTFSAGASVSLTVLVPDDASSVVFSYTAGSFEEEHSFTIVSPSGVTSGPFSDPIPFCFI